MFEDRTITTECIEPLERTQHACTHPTIDKLLTLRLPGMVSALREHLGMSEIASLSFEERLGLMIDRELTERQNKQTSARLVKARLKKSVTPEDIVYRTTRG